MHGDIPKVILNGPNTNYFTTMEMKFLKCSFYPLAPRENIYRYAASSSYSLLGDGGVPQEVLVLGEIKVILEESGLRYKETLLQMPVGSVTDPCLNEAPSEPVRELLQLEGE